MSHYRRQQALDRLQDESDTSLIGLMEALIDLEEERDELTTLVDSLKDDIAVLLKEQEAARDN